MQQPKNYQARSIKNRISIICKAVARGLLFKILNTMHYQGAVSYGDNFPIFGKAV